MMNKSIFVLMATVSFFSSQSLLAMEEVAEYETESIFTKKGPLKITLDETLPHFPDREGAQTLLNSSKLEFVKTDSTSSITAQSKEDVGYNFPNLAPWCLLATKFIKEKSDSSRTRINLGDWGCGHGFFARHAMLSGASPYVIELHRAAATEANKNIFGVRKHLPKGLKITDLYKTFVGSIKKPERFMERQNAINVCFNVLHHLNPSDADLLLKNMFENTVKGGLIMICCDAPFVFPNTAHYYDQGLKMGLKYPGFGVYNQSNILFPSNGRKSTAGLSIHRPTEEETSIFEMGRNYKGSYPSNGLLDDTKTIFVEDPTGAHPGNILGVTDPYYYQNSYQLKNMLAYPSLKSVVEEVGFTVLNGWYTDHTIDTLYPHDFDVDSSLCKKSKVVLVAKK